MALRYFYIFFTVFYFFTPDIYAQDSLSQLFELADKKQWNNASFLAKQSGNPSLSDYVQWRRLKDAETRADANAILAFLEQHKDWPDAEILLDRAEESLLLEGITWEQAKRWQLLHEELLEKKVKNSFHKDAVSYLIKHGWVNGEFNTTEQALILRAYSAQIGAKEISQRVKRLLWNEQINKARALIPLLPKAEQKLSYARIALQTNQRGIDGVLSSVPAQYRNDPVLLYERIRWRARKQLSAGVREILLMAPAKVPYPEKWWNYRAIAVRDAIASGDYSLALKLLENHGQVDDAPLADALWLSGWLKMLKRNDPASAYKDFYDLYHHVSYPVSLSRGAYWAGLAAKLNKSPDIAQNWFQEAAKHPTTFYGQLALIELGSSTPLPLPSLTMQQEHFTLPQQNMLSLVKLLARYNQKFSVEKFIQHLALKESNAANLKALGNLAVDLGYSHLRVRIGKIAMQSRHQWLDTTSHPIIPINHNSGVVEPALVLAISRQESEFNPQATSPANAIGLMQLLPSTAQHVAKKWGVAYNYTQLFRPSYNMELGSYYLAELVDKFNGSYPLAIAAYNAGPGNVSRWITKFGRPPSDIPGLLNWLESIPFAETRNYVQRVLENLQVYRAMLGHKQPLTKQRMFGPIPAK